MRYHAAQAPPRIPKTATLETQTSIKHGVKSYRFGLNGPQPSLFPQKDCPLEDVAVR